MLLYLKKMGNAYCILKQLKGRTVLQTFGKRLFCPKIIQSELGKYTLDMNIFFRRMLCWLTKFGQRFEADRRTTEILAELLSSQMQTGSRQALVPLLD